MDNPFAQFNEIKSQSEIEESSVDSYSKKLAEKELEDKFEDNNRANQYKKHIHVIVVSGIYLLGFIICLFVLVRAYHLIVPTCWKWLNGEDLHTIDAVLFSSIIFSLASKYFNYYKLFKEK